MADDLFTQLKEPTQCALWEKPELVSGRDFFDPVETFMDDSHHARSLLKCRECGQRYFYEFYEEVDWKDGDDSQYSTFIPVETDAEIEALKASSIFDLMRFLPRLHKDYRGPRGSRLGWMK
jgi:hypothetical protein